MNVKYKILGLAIAVMFTVTGCLPEQELADPISPDGYTKVTYTPNFEVTDLAEGDTLIYTITLEKAIDRALTFQAVLKSGDITEEDYYTEPVTIAPYYKEAQLSIIFYEDWEIEGTETVEFEIGLFSLAEKYLVNPATPNITTNLTVSNFVGTDLLLSFDWAKYINFEGTDYPTATNVDFDILISPAAGFDINDPWSSDYDYAAGTSACPEQFLIQPGDLPDGEYVFWSDLWANGFAGLGLTDLIPIHTNALKQGSLDLMIEQLPDDVIDADVPGYDDDGTVTNSYLCKVKIEGSVYTIYGPDGTQVGSGKSLGITKRGFPTPKPHHNGLVK